MRRDHAQGGICKWSPQAPAHGLRRAAPTTRLSGRGMPATASDRVSRGVWRHSHPAPWTLAHAATTLDKGRLPARGLEPQVPSATFRPSAKSLPVAALGRVSALAWRHTLPTLRVQGPVAVDLDIAPAPSHWPAFPAFSATARLSAPFALAPAPSHMFLPTAPQTVAGPRRMAPDLAVPGIRPAPIQGLGQ